MHTVLREYSSRSGSNAPASLVGIENNPHPYNGDVQIVDAGSESRQRLRSDLIFITSRFRSGSTALWNVFRHLEQCQAFYEPFNERRFFDQSTRGGYIDPSHLGVADYWSEYDHVEGLESLYDEDWVHRNMYMATNFWAPEMCHFIESLVKQAQGRPVLQFNRVDFRLPWLRHQFPNAFLLHLYRNPREQWCSFLMNIDEFPADAPTANFMDRYYLRIWARDLQHVFPFLADAENLHPYRIFYYIWKLSWSFGKSHSDYSFAFEDLVNQPRQTLTTLMLKLGVDTDIDKLLPLIAAPANERWQKYASPSWFEEHEHACEQDLTDFFGGIAATRSPSLNTV